MHVAGKDGFVNVSSKKETLDNLHINVSVVNHVLIAGGQQQKKAYVQILFNIRQ